MVIGIDGNMWYCSNGLSLQEQNAKFTFARTLREAVKQYREEFDYFAEYPERLSIYLDQTPEEYKMQINTHKDIKS